MGKKTKITTGAISGLVIFVFAGILSVKTICACTDANDMLNLEVGSRPMQDDPAVFRKKLLEKLPPESSIIAINKLLAEITVEGDKINGHYRDGLCKRTLNELSCGFPIREFWWGYKKSGFNLYFTLDGSDRLKDVRVSRYSVWFGE